MEIPNYFRSSQSAMLFWGGGSSLLPPHLAVQINRISLKKAPPLHYYFKINPITSGWPFGNFERENYLGQPPNYNEGNGRSGMQSALLRLPQLNRAVNMNKGPIFHGFSTIIIRATEINFEGGKGPAIFPLINDSGPERRRNC